MMMQGMNEDGVGWACGSFDGKEPPIYTAPKNDPKNTYVPLADSPYYLNTNTLAFFRQFTTEN